MARQNRGTALAKPARSHDVNRRAADDIGTLSTLAHIQKAHLVAKCGVRPALASVVATLVYGEARA